MKSDNEYEAAFDAFLRKRGVAGVSVEVYPDAKKVGQQLAFAEKRGFPFALIAGPAEFEQGVWKLKDLAKREETTVKEGELVGAIQSAVR